MGLIKYILEVTCMQEIEKTLHAFVIEVIGRIKANFIALGYPLESYGKTSLLKMPYTLCIGIGEIKLVPTWKLPLGWLFCCDGRFL